ncbi:MAG: hypothetical protein JWQ35_771 [Bacteriovoracaceae bacterium]|nr:hypothetical protein [Bacteriovoracaceae bacterium]
MNKRNFPSIKAFDQGIREYPVIPESLFKQPPQGNIDERFSIYGTGYSVRSREAMEEMFVVLPKLMGDKLWQELRIAYTLAYRSTSHNIADVGLKLPNYIRDEGFEERWAEMAELEVLAMKSFHAKRGFTLTLDDFSKISEDVRFKFQAATILFSSGFNCAAAWLNRDIKELELVPEYSIIFRKDFSVDIRILSENEFEFLNHLQTGASLGEALDRLKKQPNAEEFSQWIRTSFENNYFSELRRDS